MSRPLPRRTFLRGVLAGGAAVAIPLPRLGGMLDGNGTAYADGSRMTPRYMTWFFGNGVKRPKWIPAATGVGDAWQISPALEPLAEYKEWLTVVSGYDVTHQNTFSHASHPTGLLTGANSVQDGFVLRPTIDQKIAELINGGTAYSGGLHVGITNVSGATSMGTQISFKGPHQPNPPNFSPMALFSSLVGLSGQEPDPSLLRRQKLLDVVAQDVAELKPRLGSEDRSRLDRHLEGIDELQTQINAALKGHDCGAPINPDEAYPDRGDDGSLRLARVEAFSDLLAFAFACDLTRVATFMFSCGACHDQYSEIGLVGGFHEDFGHQNSSMGLDYANAGFDAGVQYAMSGLAKLLKRFRDMPDVDGNLLDNSIIFTTTCVGDPAHDSFDYPMLLLGKGGGLLSGNLHHRGSAQNACMLPFTLLKMFGSSETSFGEAEGYVTETISALYA